jgi:hypothetical protein
MIDLGTSIPNAMETFADGHICPRAAGAKKILATVGAVSLQEPSRPEAPGQTSQQPAVKRSAAICGTKCGLSLFEAATN